MSTALTAFSSHYAEARDRFREAAKAAGGRLEAYPIDAKGPGDSDLAIDVALVGASPDPERVVVVTSGLHGVEGFFGSAIQLAWLQAGGGSQLPAGLRLVLVHGVNPYGFAWRRRWDEHNIDLNRNFLLDRSFLTADPRYAESRRVYESLNAFLNPPSHPSPFEPYTLKVAHTILRQALAARSQLPPRERPPIWAVRRLFALGLAELKKTLPVGQYEWPKGLFYGGAEPAQATRIMQSRYTEWLGRASFVLHIDLHSGLGDRGAYKLLLVDVAGSPPAAWATAKFGAEVEPLGAEETAYQARGLMGEYLKAKLQGIAYHYLGAEFGTYPAPRVLGALRAENRAHHYGSVGDPSYEWAKRQAVEAFCPADPGWRAAVLEKGMGIIRRAIAVASEHQ